MTNNTGELSEESFAFTWKIPNLLDLLMTYGSYVTSPEFRFASATWYLRLNASIFPHHFIGVYLVRSQSSVPEHRTYHTVSLKTSHGNEYSTQSYVSTFVSDIKLLLHIFRRYEITENRQLLLPNGTLTVFCQIRMKPGTTQEASSCHQLHRNQPSQTKLQEASSQTEVPESVTQTEVEDTSTSVQKLQLDYSKLLKSEEDSDVCLKVSDKVFRTHRCILRARSKVFSAMFKHETEEKASGEVVIDDLDPDSFPDFLQHVYAGRVETFTSKNVPSLYVAADKYDLQELKSECRDYMKRTLSVDTFCDFTILSLRYQEEEFLKLATEFFSKNYTKIIVTVKWQTFLKDHHVAANELLIKALVPGEKSESS